MADAFTCEWTLPLAASFDAILFLLIELPKPLQRIRRQFLVLQILGHHPLLWRRVLMGARAARLMPPHIGRAEGKLAKGTLPHHRWTPPDRSWIQPVDDSAGNCISQRIYPLAQT